MLLRLRELNSIQRPSSRNYESVRQWFINHDPIDDGNDFIFHKEDFVALGPQEQYSFVEDMVQFYLRHNPNSKFGVSSSISATTTTTLSILMPIVFIPARW